jgi:proteasome activator subunit 4
MLFRLWESINSYNYDGRMLELLSYLARMHSDPGVSDPRRVQELPDDERSNGEGRPDWDKNDLPRVEHGTWGGIYKDVGIFTYAEWNLLMSKCLSSMGMSPFTVLMIQ